MINPVTWLSRRRFPYEPLISVEISRANLLHNLFEFTKLAPNKCIAPVLKSNAYGHGLIEVASILEKDRYFYQPDITGDSLNPNQVSIPFFVVDSYFEAIALRAKGISTPLLIIGYTRPETISTSRLKNVSFTITSLETLKALSKIAVKQNTNGGMIGLYLPLAGARKPHRIHLKIDTGMNRQGILPSETAEAIDIIEDCDSIILDGICSHLSDADNEDDTFTQNQIVKWNKIVKQFRTAFPRLRYWHISNTDGHKYLLEIEANVSRLGLGLYGLVDGNSFKPSLDLKPALSMKSIISSVKNIHTGDSVGYGNTFIADRDMTIATIPVGYFEGIDRRLSNVGHIQVGPNRVLCPIIGRVSMNICVLDVSKVSNPQIGMEAIVFSMNKTDPNSIQNVSQLCQTIPYEIAVKIPAQLKRGVV